MKFSRMLSLAAVLAVYAGLLPGSASATALTGSGGTTLGTGTKIESKSEGKVVLDTLIGNIECESSIAGKTTNAGGSEISVEGTIETLSFTSCNATVTVLANGTFRITGETGNKGEFRSTGAKVTVEKSGFHCIFETSSTKIGTLTGGTTATLDISATVPRTGGRSGAFCGSSAPWTGSYKVNTPDTLNIDTGGGGGGGEPTSTTITTSLSGEAKSGEEITINEGSKVKDTATLSGTNAGKATGTVKYKVYADKECKELVTSAGEVTVSEGKVPSSEEKTLEAGRVYYWQAEYSGDANNKASISTCGKEVLTVKASTSISTSLSGESKSGEEITVNEGSKVKDTATLSGTRASSSTGKVKFKVYKDKECKELVAEAGEGSLSEGKASSEEKVLEAGTVYYWQAEYPGDSLHQASTSTCGKEVLTVKAAMSLATSLVGENTEGGKPIEGEEISLTEGAFVADTATLSGTRSASATGKVKFKVYKDKECKELATEAGEVSVEKGTVPASEELQLEPGTYRWQATYEGDSLHQASASPCTEVVNVRAATSLATSLSGEAEEGAMIEVSEDAVVSDTATLSGAKAEEATGTVKYSVYSDFNCKELVAEAGEVTVAGKTAPASTGQTLEPGIYFWRAVYSGDSANAGSAAACGAEIEIVLPRITTTLSAGEHSGEVIEVPEGTAVEDQATLHGEHASEATGSVKYSVYSDEECKKLVTSAGEVGVEGASVPASTPVEIKEVGVYYWQASYSGDELNPAAIGECGTEVAIVTAPTTVTTTLQGGGEEGTEIKVEEGTGVTDQAALSGSHAASAKGAVTYTPYADSGCTEVAENAGVGTVTEGSAGASAEVNLPAGTYYWQAEYSGDGVNGRAVSPCGSEKEIVTTPITTSLSGGGQSGPEIQVAKETSVTDEATLYGAHAGEATGTVKYRVYSDEQCEKLFASAGEVKVEGAKVPASSAVEFKEEGGYYWKAEYSGDAKNPAATSPCGSEEVQVRNNWAYAALGDSYSAGVGVRVGGGNYYGPTNIGEAEKHGENQCWRSRQAWPGLIAESVFEEKWVKEPAVFQRTPRFIFRACKGATIPNVWNGAGADGQYDELEEPKDTWQSTPLQALWLTDGKNAPNQAITRVTLTIGGNDAGFAAIGAACWARRIPKPLTYNPAACQKKIADEEKNLPSIKTGLPGLLKEILARAPNAKIRVLLYPRVLNLNVEQIPVGNVPLVGAAVINNAARGGDLTAAESLWLFISRLNRAVTEGVTAANLPRARVFARTESALDGPFGPHRLGDANPWLNGIIAANSEESFHPNICGHRAVARLVQGFVGPGKAIATC